MFTDRTQHLHSKRERSLSKCLQTEHSVRRPNSQFALRTCDGSLSKHEHLLTKLTVWTPNISVQRLIMSDSLTKLTVCTPNLSVRRPNSVGVWTPNVYVCRQNSVFADETQCLQTELSVCTLNVRFADRTQTELSVGCSQTKLGVCTQNVSVCRSNMDVHKPNSVFELRT